ncbi:TPA: nucleotidyltransferase domain-containing protein [Candidatus Woesearchaeota archaeon]|nr:nucleotidyltransferase domain-containing protein [Candidatus Woesearchaeota archaeon]
MDTLLRIINYLAKNHLAAPTMHSLAVTLKIPYATFYRTLKAKSDLFLIETVGKAKTIRLNLDQDVIIAYLTLASWGEREEFLEHHTIIRKICEDLPKEEVVLLFGSYAKGTATERSDIDILIINKNGKKTTSFSKHELLYKKTINPIIVSRKEFENMLRDSGENVGKQALKNHVVLQEPQQFWEMTLRAIRPRRVQETI